MFLNVRLDNKFKVREYRKIIFNADKINVFCKNIT